MSRVDKASTTVNDSQQLRREAHHRNNHLEAHLSLLNSNMVAIQRVIGHASTCSYNWKIVPMSSTFSILNKSISFSLVTVVAMIEENWMVSAPLVFERSMEASNQR